MTSTQFPEIVILDPAEIRDDAAPDASIVDVDAWLDAYRLALEVTLQARTGLQVRAEWSPWPADYSDAPAALRAALTDPAVYAAATRYANVTTGVHALAA